MPLQNRVDPFGALWAVQARGTLMGNRGGRFHDDDRRLGRRRYVSRRWIACVCDFKARQREVWGKSYTELFFLDEVTALAAGHRPCFECRRAEAKDFIAAFPFADRLVGTDKRCFIARVDSLPDGAMFAHAGDAYVLRKGNCLRWSHGGYRRCATVAKADVSVLTPASILTVLQRGYAPRWHESAN